MAANSRTNYALRNYALRIRRAALVVVTACFLMPAPLTAQNIASMNDRTLELFSKGQLDDALNAAAEALEAARTKGEVDFAFATALGNNAELLRMRSRFVEAMPLFDEASRSYQRLNAASNPSYATLMNNFGLLALNQGQYQQAKDRFLTSIKIRSDGQAPDQQQLATTFNNLGDAEAALGNRSRAIAYFSKVSGLNQSATSTGIYSHMRIGTLEGELSHFSEAEAAYSAAVHDALQLDSPDFVGAAQAQLAIATGDHMLHRYEKAEAQLSEASKSLALAKTPAPQIAFSIMSEKGSLLRDMRRFDEAGSAYNEALKLLNQSKEADLSEKAMVENALGVLNVRTGKYADAEASFKSALSMLHDADQQTSYTAASAATNLGFMLADSGRLEEASGFLESALNIFNQNNNQTDPNYGSLLSNLAIVYQQQSRFVEAERLFEQTLQFDAAVYGKQSVQYAISLDNMADLYNQERRWPDAAKAATAATVILNLRDAQSASRVNAFHRLGIAELQMGAIDSAVSDLEQARTLAETLGEAGRIVLAGTLQDLGSAYDLKGDSTKALDTFKAAIDLNTKLYGADSPAVAASNFNLGWFRAAQKDYEQALNSFEDGNRIVVQRLLNDWSLSGLEVAGNRYRPSGSEFGFTGAIQAGSRIELNDPVAKNTLAKRLFVAAQWADIADSAFSIGLMAARSSSNDLELQRKVRERQDLSFAIDKLQKLLIRMYASDDPQNLDIEKRVANAREELASLKKKSSDLDIELSSTKTKFMQFANPSALSVSEVQAYLKEDEALISFFTTPTNRGLEGETFIWVVTRSDVHLSASPINDRVMVQFVRTLRCGLDRTLWARSENGCANLTEESRDEGAPLPFRLDLAYALYWQLFGQIEQSIVGKKLLIVSRGILATLPLEILPTKWPDFDSRRFADDYSEVDWLIKEHPIAILPSVNSLRLFRSMEHPQPAPLAFVGFGDPKLRGNGDCLSPRQEAACPGSLGTSADQKFEQTPVRSGSLKSVFKDGSDRGSISNNVQLLCPLPDTSRELKCIAEAIGGTVFLADNFTKSALNELSRTGTLAKYRVVDFATHGLLPDNDRDESIEPSLVTTPSEDDDGLLRASEIARLKLNADWVVLAACNTGSGAGGMKGLADAFFYAGARAILVSNWETNSYATVLLSVGLAAAIKTNPGMSLTDAHRESVLLLINDRSQPRFSQPEFWAPFTVVGGAALQ
jgi:CHAT domain-containing protein/tetratricopeptide (TPR) repeat protein